MSYFGWIPILTPKLLFREAITDLETYRLTNTNDECVLRPKINLSSSSKLTKKQEMGCRGLFTEELKQQIKNHLQIAKNEKLYFYLRDFNDINIQSLTKVAFTIDRTTSKIRKMGIFSHTTFKIIAIAEILDIEETGLVNYKLNGKHDSLRATQIFGEIRDIYHEHIYAPHGDFALMPVEANDRNEAIDAIFSQYQNKVVAYHCQLKRELDTIERRYGNISSRHLHSCSTLAATAKGEIIYSLSFINLFKLNVYENHMRLALDSLSNLTNKYGHILTLRQFISSWKISIIAILAVTVAFYNILLSPWLNKWELLLKLINIPIISTILSSTVLSIIFLILALVFSYLIVEALVAFHSYWITRQRSLPKFDINKLF